MAGIGCNHLQLGATSDAAFLAGHPSRVDDAATRLADAVAALDTDVDLSNTQLAMDACVTRLTRDDAGSANAVYTNTATFDDDSAGDTAVYLDCRMVALGEEVPGIGFIIGLDRFNEQMAVLEVLLPAVGELGGARCAAARVRGGGGGDCRC